MDFTGKIPKVFPIKEFKNNCTKRDFVVVDETSQYPQYITFQLVKDRCSLIEKFKEGDVIKVAFNLNGREWIDPKTNEPKYFNSLVAWKIEPADEGGSARSAGAPNEPPDEFAANSEDMQF